MSSDQPPIDSVSTQESNPTTPVESTPLSSKPSSSSSTTTKGYKPFPWYRLFVFDLLLWFFSIIFDCFFREIRSRGAFRIPQNDPVIFVGAPHANQFVDGVLLMNQVKREAQRRVSFMIAESSYKLKLIGFMSKCQLSIPVVRVQDTLTKGIGKIYCNFDEDPLLITGKGTQFLTECSVRGLIALPQFLGASEIVEIISDTKLKIRKEFKKTDQILTLLTNGTSFKKADKIDQKKVFKYVFNHLSHGNCLGIFPEGGSHDRTDLLPLKAGVAIMALGAMENDPNCNVKIVPCGMNYFNAHKFRSRAVIEYGHPIEIPKELVKKYSNPETNKEAVKELLEIVTTGLKAVTVLCEDYETLMVVQAARRLYAQNFAHHLPLPLIVEMNRRLVMGYEHYKHEPKVQEIKTKILKYNEMLNQLYLPDHHVEECDESNKLRVLPVLILRILKLIFFVILALPGATLFSPVFLSAKLISKRKAEEAVLTSSVKIKALDVIATWKILVSMGIAPIVYSFYASIGTYYAYTRGILQFKLISIWLLLYCLGVLVTYAALVTGEQGLDLFKSIRPLYLSVTNGSSIKELKKFRDELSEDITELVNTFGPQLFPKDFNLLDMKQRLNITDEVNYVDSDEEEDRKTEELRHRRQQKRKDAKRAAKKIGERIGLESSETDLSLQKDDKHSSSVSDGISLMNSDNSLTNIPMFSDYQLHQNVKNKDLVLEQQSTLPSTSSIYDDYRYSTSNELHRQYPHLSTQSHSSSNSTANSSKVSRTSSSENVMELNFDSKLDHKNLSDKIKSKLRESRGKED
ncbi:glycerol-3-phosphate O-acyltransferase [Scheffersomyces coipomensis]|uniref:glycerol-3-phosphate O-acyltransferase n=1 Tax=Scheffersomyces coipomensis TaxID=1788519 RepID=UPI00315D9453